MIRWELTCRYCNVVSKYGYGEIDNIWQNKDENGKSDWDCLCDLAKEGWELVSVTPITEHGNTIKILYTFKRPVTSEPL